MIRAAPSRVTCYSACKIDRMIDTRAIRLRWDADGSKRDERGKRVVSRRAWTSR
jgi:hypothetical protein